MAAPIDWTDTVLCIDADLQEFETDVLAWTGGEAVAGKWRAKAKDLIAQRLDLKLRSVEEATDAADVKDLIGNPEVLKDAACYLSLHLLANDISHGAGDMYDRKAEMYHAKYEAELERAMALVHLDLDESGTIEDSEKYTAPTGVTFKHGG
jgi:hypothetical protein